MTSATGMSAREHLLNDMRRPFIAKFQHFETLILPRDNPISIAIDDGKSGFSAISSGGVIILALMSTSRDANFSDKSFLVALRKPFRGATTRSAEATKDIAD